MPIRLPARTDPAPAAATPVIEAPAALGAEPQPIPTYSAPDCPREVLPTFPPEIPPQPIPPAVQARAVALARELKALPFSASHLSAPALVQYFTFGPKDTRELRHKALRTLESLELAPNPEPNALILLSRLAEVPRDRPPTTLAVPISSLEALARLPADLPVHVRLEIAGWPLRGALTAPAGTRGLEVAMPLTGLSEARLGPLPKGLERFALHDPLGITAPLLDLPDSLHEVSLALRVEEVGDARRMLTQLALCKDLESLELRGTWPAEALRDFVPPKYLRHLDLSGMTTDLPERGPRSPLEDRLTDLFWLESLVLGNAPLRLPSGIRSLVLAAGNTTGEPIDLKPFAALWENQRLEQLTLAPGGTGRFGASGSFALPPDLTELTIRGPLTEGALIELQQNLAASEVRRLDLDLRSCPTWLPLSEQNDVPPRLAELTLHALFPTAGNIPGLARLLEAPALESLTLGFEQIGDAQQNSPVFRDFYPPLPQLELGRVKTLCLRSEDGQLPWHQVGQLLSAAPALRQLDLFGLAQGAPEACVGILPRSQLERLALWGCKLDDSGLTQLLTHQDQLHSLALPNNALTGDLSALPWPGTLRALELQDNRIEGPLDALTAAPGLSQLTYLDVRGTALDLTAARRVSARTRVRAGGPPPPPKPELPTELRTGFSRLRTQFDD